MPRTRLRSLDVFRGLTVAAMLLVSFPGSDAVYPPLRHADWHGFTPADLIFPAFLTILGVSAAFSSRGAGRVLLRAAILLALGVLANIFVFDGIDGVRFPGVLQRIALCYLGVEAFLHLDRPRAAPAAAAALLGLYGLLLAYVPVPGHGAGVLTPEGNLAYWLDRRVFGGHLLESPWGDPEGLLPTLPALASSLMGLAAGRRLKRDGAAAANALGAAGLGLAALGLALSPWIPLNKHLWTSTFALLTSGLSLAGLAACLRLVEGRRAAWTPPFEALGRRALAVYLAAGFAFALFEFLGMKARATALLEMGLAPETASLAYAALFTVAAAAALLAVRALERRKLGRGMFVLA